MVYTTHNSQPQPLQPYIMSFNSQTHQVCKSQPPKTDRSNITSCIGVDPPRFATYKLPLCTYKDDASFIRSVITPSGQKAENDFLPSSKSHNRGAQDQQDAPKSTRLASGRRILQELNDVQAAARPSSMRAKRLWANMYSRAKRAGEHETNCPLARVHIGWRRRDWLVTVFFSFHQKESSLLISSL